MIKFFRKIRQNLISEGKMTKYLKYAIGEIILVVIGILIALSINNWNENQKRKQLEITYYQNLYKDLQQDSIEYRNKKHNAKRNIEKLKNILSFINNEYDIKKSTISKVNWGRANVFKDTSALWISLSQAGFLQYPNIFQNTITDLRSTGNIKQLTNTILKDEIIKYYNFQKLFDAWNQSYLPNRTEIDLVINRILPPEARAAYNQNNNEIMKENLKTKGYYHEFIESIKKEPELKGLTNGMYHIQTRIINQCENRYGDLKELMEAVSSEIELLNEKYK